MPRDNTTTRGSVPRVNVTEVADGGACAGVFWCVHPQAGCFYLIAKVPIDMTITRVEGKCTAGTNCTVKFWINDEDEDDDDSGTELYGGSGKTFTTTHDVDTRGDFTNPHMVAHQNLWAETDAVTGAVTLLRLGYELRPKQPT